MNSKNTPKNIMDNMMKNKYIFFFYIIILIISSTKLVAYGNNLGFGYSDYGCTLSVDRKLYCNRKGLKGLIYINDLPEDLEHLYLNDNNITSIQKETFDKSKRLRRLYLNIWIGFLKTGLLLLEPNQKSV